jgi:hypothetical protein
MPLITPPDDESFESESKPIQEDSSQEVYWKYRKIKLFMDCPDWKCPECACIVFGRCKECPYCKYKLGRITRRPEDWRKE